MRTRTSTTSAKVMCAAITPYLKILCSVIYHIFDLNYVAFCKFNEEVRVPPKEKYMKVKTFCCKSFIWRPFHFASKICISNNTWLFPRLFIRFQDYRRNYTKSFSVRIIFWIQKNFIYPTFMYFYFHNYFKITG